MDLDSTSQKSNVIRPLNASEASQFFKDYKELFLTSIKKCPPGTNSDKLIEKINNLPYVQSRIDPNCVLEINRRLVRIEYPGEVRNVNRAIETLGGMANIESSVADHSKKLELRFHPKNRFNKLAAADKDFKAGILIKVKKNSFEVKPGSSKDDDLKHDYEVVGVSVMNFSFNRLCDFQFLPLVAEQPESRDSKTDCIYEKIVPKELPTYEWLVSEESKNLEQFLLPVSFAHYDSSQAKLNVDTQEKSETKTRLRNTASNTSLKLAAKQQKNICRIFGKTKQQISIFVNFKDPEVPTKPLEASLKILENKALEERVDRVRQLFEERPIWTKAAIRYNTGLTVEQAKFIVPVVAYYFVNGPWRIAWVKFGYDPRKEPNARIYQTLDYRIRTAESTQLKVKPKRSYTCKSTPFLGPQNLKKISLKDDIASKPRLELDERCYVLRPFTIPPARQMFYQLCDLILPEVQDLISKLPTFPGRVCDSKSGWLPKNFIENCREIVNRHVLEAVQKELLEDRKVLQEKVTKEEESRKKDAPSGLDYCNQMLDNIKKGIYNNVYVAQSVSNRVEGASEDAELIDLSSDDDEDEFTVGEIIKSSIPEKLAYEDEDEQDDNLSHVSDDAEIDPEVVQEINDLISQSNTTSSL